MSGKLVSIAVLGVWQPGRSVVFPQLLREPAVRCLFYTFLISCVYSEINEDIRKLS